jgi:hypothetical protein
MQLSRLRGGLRRASTQTVFVAHAAQATAPKIQRAPLRLILRGARPTQQKKTPALSPAF